jgi:hypothetical protein
MARRQLETEQPALRTALAVGKWSFLGLYAFLEMLTFVSAKSYAFFYHV